MRFVTSVKSLARQSRAVMVIAGLSFTVARVAKPNGLDLS